MTRNKRLDALDDRVGSWLRPRLLRVSQPRWAATHAAAEEGEPGSAPTLEVHRTRGWSDRLHNYVVVLDGEPAGPLWPNETFRRTIAPGDHDVWLAVHLTGSQRVHFNVRDGQVVHLTATPQPLWIGPLKYARLLARRLPWIELHPTESASP